MNNLATSNDESWQISVDDLDLRSEGRYIACALVERVKGFDFPFDGFGLIKRSYPLISADRVVINQIEVLEMDNVATPIRTLDHVVFMRAHQNTRCLAVRWIVDTMQQLKALGVLRSIALAQVPFTTYTDSSSNKTLTGVSYALVPMGHPKDKVFVFSRITRSNNVF